MIFAKRKGTQCLFGSLRQQKERQSQSGQVSNVVLITKNPIKNSAVPYDECLWIANSGVTLHTTNSLSGMFDLQPSKVDIIVGNEKSIQSSQKGKTYLEVMQPYQKNAKVI